LLFKDFQKKKESLKDTRRKDVLSKYGGDEHMNLPNPELLLMQVRIIAISQTATSPYLYDLIKSYQQ
jgi:hypothetical protein